MSEGLKLILKHWGDASVLEKENIDGYSFPFNIENVCREIDSLHSRIDKLREALEFYANSNGLCDNESVDDGPITHLIAGRRARQALAEDDKMKGDNNG